jgi:(p)ppGpp synthase/HD superfamily hydrolase
VRKGPKEEAFYNHPRRVCKSYLAFRNKSVSGLIAALCHDLVEDTSVSFDGLEELFGADVRNIVFDLTKPPNISSEEYAKNIIGWRLESRKIKLCDIEDNIQDSRDIPLEQRLRMLVRWKKYLEKLGRDPESGGVVRNNELAEKWHSVNDLHTKEMAGLNLRINLLRKGV